MRKIREVLRLKFEAGLSDRQIAAAVGSSISTMQECLRRCRAAGMGWPLPPELDEPQLLAVVRLPDFATVHRELACAGVTRPLLWEEYKAAHPEGLQYTAFCVHYQRWRATQELVFRYAGQTVPILDRHSGEERCAQIVVAVLGASNHTYAEPTWTQSLPGWLASHVRALEYFGSVPRALVPDNLESAVKKAHRSCIARRTSLAG
jgi:transposase